MNILALDTSTERLCVALCTPDGMHLHEEEGGARASQRLLPAAQALIAGRGLVWGGLDGLAFGQGPGAFTGLRATCAAIQGLALGLGVQAVAVPSLWIVAEDARLQAQQAGVLAGDEACMVRVAMDARMGQVYDGVWAWDGGRWHEVEPAAVRAPLQTATAWSGAPARAGGAAVLHAGTGLELMPEDLGGVLREHSRGWWIREQDRSAALGRCALQAWHAAPRLDAAQVMPLYVRDRVALTTLERQGLAAAQEAQA